MTTAAAASIEPAPLCVYFADMRDLNGDDVDALVTDDDRAVFFSTRARIRAGASNI